MKRDPKWELVALTALTMAIIVAIVMIVRIAPVNDIAVGGLIAALPVALQNIRSMGTSETMQRMADQLGSSQPATEPQIQG